ncbi:hypothetical protein [Clostridium neonatale]|uniref:hypothetical protein n=1 Tax=Clostridium neonatale TaxID=137838 RepID=UPI00291BBE8B|nr:hypothetical protein [Clostridium neonatale]CAI3573251.1 conserved hypothetical protein [Clostridium neonatale]CAI3654525.1 conserved hypothetical protein [Clostridium neonatale]
MYKIFLDENLFDYLIKNLEDKKIKNIILDNKNKEDEKVYFEIDVDTKLDLMEYVEDLQLEIGFDNEDYLNEDGKKLQIIIDELYNQTN